MALEKGLRCVSALCQSWIKADWNEATEEREARVLLWGGRSSSWALLRGFTGCWKEALMKSWERSSFGGVRSDLCALVGQTLTVELGEFCGGISQELAMLLLEKATSLYLGGGSTAVVLQDPSRAVEQVGLLLEGVWMECSIRALFSWGVLVPCYPPTNMDFFLLVPRWSFCLLFLRMERVGWSWRFLQVARVCNLWYEGRPQVFEFTCGC